MSLFVFNNQQKLVKSIPNRDLISVVQDQAINVSDTLFVEMPADIWSNLKEPASYLAVQDPYERFSYHMYKVSKHTTKADTTDVEAIQVGYDELKAYGYIKDRRFNNRPVLEAATAIVDGTDWQLGYIDTNLPNVNTNFYYISRLEALSKLIEATGAEVRFRIEISGNKIIAKRMDLYKKLGTFKGKRFAYGSNLLEIVKEEDTSELYTALVGRGKGEETDTGGFGRRITFADIAWSKASGKPVDKPLGQEFIELPEMTAYYGYPDGEPRTGIVEFGDIEEPEQLLKATYNRLVEISRPQVQFKAKVQTTGDMQLGEEVAIIRSDLGFRYKTRVFRVKRDYLNNMYTEVELGDKLTETLASRIKKIDATNSRREETIIQYIQTAANGKNKIFRGPVEPTEGMMVNDLWYKPVGEGETMLYTWNGEIWELSKVSAGLLAGTLDAENGDVNLINVNVANIVGETSDFVRSNWNNGIGGSVQATGDGLVANASNGSQASLQNGVLLVRGSDGVSTGYIGFSQDGSNNNFTLTTANGRSLQIRYSNDDGTFSALIEYLSYLDSLYFGKRAVFQSTVEMNGDLNMNQKKIIEVQKLRTGILETGNIGSILNDTDNRIVLKGTSGAKIGVGGQVDGGFTPIIMVDSTRAYIYRNLSMEGNDITNQSDERLKENIVKSDYDGLRLFREIEPKSFTWKNKERFGLQTELGFIAQQLASIDPEIVTQTPDDDAPDGVAWAINETQMNRRSWIATHQLVKENDTLKQELADLKAVLSEKGLI